MKFKTWFIIFTSTLVNNCHDNTKTHIKEHFNFSYSDILFKYGDNYFYAPNPNEKNSKNLKINIPDSCGEKDSDKLSFYTESMIHDMQFNVTMEITDYHVIEEKLKSSILCIFDSIKFINPFRKTHYIEFECNNLKNLNYFSTDGTDYYFNFLDDENNVNRKVKINKDDYTLLSNSKSLKFGLFYDTINHYDLTSEIGNDNIKIEIL